MVARGASNESGRKGEGGKFSMDEYDETLRIEQDKRDKEKK